MSYEIDGVLAVSVITAILLWFASTIWALADAIRTKKPAKWIILSIIPLGPLYYYLSHGGSLRELAIKRWPLIAVIFIILAGMYVRLLDYHWVYLRNIDSYTFYRQMGEIVANNGVLPARDNLILAPDGAPRLVGLQPFVYLGAYSYMLVNAFVKLPLLQFLIYFPPFMASLAAIPIYFIGKMLYDRKAGVLAAFYFVFDISNLSRTLGGDPDSDASIFLISMAAIAMAIFVYKLAEKESIFSKKLVLSTVLAGIVMFVWFQTWAGYWYVFWLLAGFIALRTIFNIIHAKDVRKGIEESKLIIASFVIYMTIAFTLACISFGSTGILTDAIAGPIQFQSIKGEDSQFPNVYVSVAELQQSGGPKEIIERTSVLGGPAILISPFFLLLYALAYLLYSYYKKRQHIDTILLLLVWFVGPFLATIVAVRFSTLFSAPLAIGSAIILSKLIRMASGEDKSFGD